MAPIPSALKEQLLGWFNALGCLQCLCDEKRGQVACVALFKHACCPTLGNNSSCQRAALTCRSAFYSSKSRDSHICKSA
eukprot:4164007-Amphidinium_carterae.1